MGIKILKGSDIEDKDIFEEKKDIKEIVREVESRTKIMELDFERRLSYLEKEIEIVRSLIGKIKDEKALKALLKNSEEIREKLRNLEDLKYVEHLEIMDTIEKVDELAEKYEEIKKIVDFVKKALEEIPELNEFALQFKDKYEDIEKRISNIDKELLIIHEEYAKNQELVKVKDSVAKINAEIERALKDIKEITKSYKENVKTNEKLAKLIEQRYEELSNKMEKYDSYSQEIDNIKKKLDEFAKKIIELKHEEFNKSIAKFDYVLKRYEKAMNLLQYEIEHLKKNKGGENRESVEEHIKEMKKLKEEIEDVLEKAIKVSPQKITQIKKLLDSKTKRIVEYEKEIEEINKKIEDHEIRMEVLEKNLNTLKEKFKQNGYVDHVFFDRKIKEIEESLNNSLKNIEERIEKVKINGSDVETYNINKQFLEMSKNLTKIMDNKLKEIRKEMLKNIKEGVRYEMDKTLHENLIEMLKNEIIYETMNIIGAHEQKEEEKIETLKEFEKYLASEMDKIKNQIMLELKDAISKSKEHDELKDSTVWIKGEIMDMKKKLSKVIEEQERKINELEEKLRKVAKFKVNEATPYIIE